jgi:hypothetical protein
MLLPYQLPVRGLVLGRKRAFKALPTVSGASTALASESFGATLGSDFYASRPHSIRQCQNGQPNREPVQLPRSLVHSCRRHAGQ